ncbi:MAG: DUF3696 domain-containing protein [Nostocales cyanobacterium LE14-WE4]|jgi:predicted ATPase|nr:DUF3696 domain-containing protein [Anabaena sp. 49633_E8]MCE2699938.1 DUF3696 domain-containing protein [Anabaena sp. 49633_E8]MDJ0501387.1 DUF3696 domain-containing protein [Nostocales cyanobacterium LE14-WE4]
MSISFSLSNFKGFKELQSVNLKPLTVICGTNNSGKSSLIQSLVLMKQSNTINSKISPNNYEQEPLIFNGVYVKLGSFLDVVYNHSNDEEIVLKWQLKNEQIETRPNKYYSINSELTVNIKNIEIENSLTQPEVNNFLFKDLNNNFFLELIRKSDGKYQVKFRNILVKDIILQWVYRNYKYRYYYNNKIPDLLKYLEDKSIKVFQEGIIEEEYFDNAQVTFQSIFPTQILINNFPQQSYSILKRIKEKLPSIAKGKVSKYLDELIDTIVHDLESIIFNLDKQLPPKDKYLDIVDLSLSKEDPDLSISNELSLLDYYFSYRATFLLLKKIWSSFRYIGPIRKAPERFYLFDNLRKIDIGISGEYTPLVLAAEKEKITPKYYRCICEGKYIKKYELRDRDTLIDSVNWWLSDFMKLPRIHSVNELSGVINQVKVNSLGIKLDLTDVGFGVSQILPIIVECLRMPEGETIILEQPEIHLHPSLQSKLADFFVCMAKSGKNLVVETHSEHFIYRLCLRIAQEESNDTRNLINILFVSCDEENKSSIAKPIEVNKYGEIENWPVGFFDENDSRDLISATLKKRMSNL